MSETPQELRERAAALEQQAEDAETRRTGFWCGYVWDMSGCCFEEWLITVPCPDHTKSYTDDYGSWVSCRNCTSMDGTNRVPRRIPAPQHDAPRPPTKKPQ